MGFRLLTHAIVGELRLRGEEYGQLLLGEN